VIILMVRRVFAIVSFLVLGPKALL